MVTWFVEIRFGSHSIWISYNLYKSWGSRFHWMWNSKFVKIWGGSLLESQCRSLQFVETLWESLVCGSQQISTLCEDQLWTTFFSFVRSLMLAVIVDWLFFSLNIRAFPKIISSKFCSPNMLHSMLVVIEFTVKRFIKRIWGRGSRRV